MSGCTTSGSNQYGGLAPILDAAAVEQSSTRVNRILNSLARDTGGGNYYDLTEAGFNYIDDQCNDYFGKLFYLNRRREAVKSGLTAFSQTTSAVLAAADASTLSMAVVAQAFGLASSMTEIGAGTYLYQLPPATTQSFVRKLQGAYRDAVAAKAPQIRSPTTAYHLIQDYLALCLPPVIEAKLIEHVSEADAVPVRGGSISNIEIDVSTPAGKTTRPSVEIIRNAGDPVRPVRPVPVAQQPKAIGSYEPRLSRQRVARIQRTLCVTPVTGIIEQKTRIAIDEFFDGVEDGATGRTYPGTRQGGIQAVHEDKLLQAEKEVGGACVPSRDKSPFEIGKLLS